MEDDERTAAKMKEVKLEDGPSSAPAGEESKADQNSATSTPSARIKNDSRSSTMSPDEMKIASDSTSTPEPSQPPKLSRKTSHKSASREPPLFAHFPDATADSTRTFQVISDCLYGSKHMGSTDNDVLDCDCREEWRNGENHACGEDSDCINRATKMECVSGVGNCGDDCQNQRFQKKIYADVSVIKTEKKGFGLRTNIDLHANDFIFEYIGEVINEPTFRRRMMQYDEEGIKHFYFMSLTKSEFVDATKKGNLGRFCNHSCNPNCYVDKWVVGEKLRMGIFALRKVKAGEELVFNYNVDRYGADPQPCYCGEPNCTGYIGGKTQTERATKLPTAMVEALGIDDPDGWDTAVAKRPRKKKPDEDDEEYVNSVQARGLDEEGVRKVMAALVQCKEKWIAVKLLERIQRCHDERVIHSVVRMHAYQILKTTLNTFIEDHNVVLQVLDILYKFPRLTKNKIDDSKIETTIQGLTTSAHEDVAQESIRLLGEWDKLEVAYRIKRKKGDAVGAQPNSFQDERRNADREEETKAASPLPNVDIPKGPRSIFPQRNASFFHGQRPPRRNYKASLPQGWFEAQDDRGATYYYTKDNTTTWQRPTMPAEPPTKVTPKALQDQALYQSILDQITKEQTPRQSAVQTPQPVETPVKEVKKERWRSLPIEKQMKIYENTLFPHVKHVMDKFHHKLPKEDLKRFGRDINKKLVASDYKNRRVQDPTAPLGEKEERKVRKYVKEFFDKAVIKFKDHEKRKKAREAASSEDKGEDKSETGLESSVPTPAAKDYSLPLETDDVVMTEDEDGASQGSSGRKRKRDDGDVTPETPGDEPTMKRAKDDEIEDANPPPPPPPPPDAVMDDALTEDQRALREQEEALERENEEAQRLEDEAAKEKLRREEEALTRENEEAMRDFEAAHHQQSAKSEGRPLRNSQGRGDAREDGAAMQQPRGDRARKQEVLSH